MNAEVRPMKSAAEKALADAFASVQAKLPGDREIARLRANAFRQFDAQGLPHRRIEEWKYTDLRALMREARPLAPPPDAAARAEAGGAGRVLSDIERRRLVFVDGAFVPELSEVDDLSEGLSIRPMAAALAAGDPLVLAHLGKVVPMVDDPAVSLNTALMGDGAVIHLAAGMTAERPLHLVFVAGGKPVATFPRSLVVISKGARAMLVESHEGPDGPDYQVNAMLEIAVGEDAHVDHVKITQEGAQALHISTMLASIGPRARFNAFSYTTGGAVVRNQLFLRFDGEDALASVRGASLLKDRQHCDTTLVADHARAGCQSRETFKTVLDDEARGIFQGKIIVRPHAQKTDARMMTQALLLSEKAEADNKPELEIFADDVQCGHGATAGALDDELKFYLMARGIPKSEAEALLIQAFVGEAVEGIEHAGLREVLMEGVAAWLKARG
jgi:Fe-S cluster assembly protein SufD